MVRMDGKIASDALLHVGFVVSKHMREVTSPIERMIRLYKLTMMILMSIDDCADLGQFRKEIHGIFVVVLPIFTLVDSLLVSLKEFAVLLQVQDGH